MVLIPGKGKICGIKGNNSCPKRKETRLKQTLL